MITRYYIFAPLDGGVAFDPASTGGTVDNLFFYATPDDRDAGSNAVVTLDSAIALGNGTYRFTLPTSLPEGRYWLRGSWRRTLLDDPVFQNVDALDYPIDNPPIVRAEEVAPLLGLSIPLDASVRAQLNECIADGQAAVELAIGSIIPKKLQLTNAFYDETSVLDRYAASTWFVDPTNVTIEEWFYNPNGTYNVTYWYGFDGRDETPIKRFIIRYAAAWWRKAFGGDQSFGQVIASISTEGQSVSYNTRERSTDVDTSLGMSLEALIKRYGSADKSNSVGVFQRRNNYYGEDRTYWVGDGYDDFIPWWV